MNSNSNNHLASSSIDFRGFIVKFLLAVPLLLGMLYPDSWWGTHFPAFLPAPWNLVWPVLALILLFAPWQQLLSRFFPHSKAPLRSLNWKTSTVYALAASLLLLLALAPFSIAHDLFGDAENFKVAFDKNSGKVDHLDYLFSVNVFHPKSGERTVLNLVAVLMERFNLTVEAAFDWIGKISFFLYSFIVVSAAIRLMGLRGIFWGIGLILAPTLLLFMGHIEIYAPLFPALAGFCALALKSFTSPNRKVLLIWMPLVLFICLKLHLSSLLLLPIWVLLVAVKGKSKAGVVPDWFSWKKMGLWFLLPLFLGAMALYFFVLGDYNDSRDPRVDLDSYKRIFLPLLPPEIPLDRYHLFHYHHLFDFFNILWICCPVGIAVVVGSLASKSKRLILHAPEVMLMALTVLLYLGFFFLLNPLLGMPFDWDLIAIPAPVLVFFTLAVISQPAYQKQLGQLIGPTLAFAFWALAILPVHAQPDSLSDRYVALGKHSFKTYWTGSIHLVQSAALMQIEDPERFQSTVETTLEDLRSYAVLENDLEYAILAKNYGNYLRVKMNRPADSKVYHELAYRYDSTLVSNLAGLVDLSMKDQRYKDAVAYCKTWVLVTQSDPGSAYYRGIEAALRAEEWELALLWNRDMVQLHPKAIKFQVLLDRLENRKEMDRIWEAFQP